MSVRIKFVYPSTALRLWFRLSELDGLLHVTVFYPFSDQTPKSRIYDALRKIFEDVSGNVFRQGLRLPYVFNQILKLRRKRRIKHKM